MKAYKAFNRIGNKRKCGDCRGMIYKEGEIYSVEDKPKICSIGYHFCKDLVLTSSYYEMDLDNTIYAEVEVLGEIDWDEPTRHKGSTNKIMITKFLTKKEVLSILDGHYNSGRYNSGHYNSGDYNSGDFNSGNRNSGHYNSGHYNSGDFNSGDFNSGNRNSGDYNSGRYNSGDFNSGNRNSGDYNSGDYNSGHYNSGGWNATDRSTGYFNSEDEKMIKVFNKDCLFSEWKAAEKPNFLYFNIDKNLGYKASFQKAYDRASQYEKELLLKLPNFDAKVFFEISGIDVGIG